MQTIQTQHQPLDGDASAKIYPDRYIGVVPNGVVCNFTGLRHAKLYSLLAPGGTGAKFVRVAYLRDPGASRGKVLFHLGDWMRWMDTLATERASAQTDEVDA